MSVNTPAPDIFNFMKNHWNLEQPRLLISVTGGAKSFNMDPKLQEHFSSGLVKVKYIYLSFKASNTTVIPTSVHLKRLMHTILFLYR